MIRADVYVARVVNRPKGVLVLCPGFNGNGVSLAKNPAWRKFAIDHDLGILAISFASASDELHAERGYYYADQGSGRILLDAIKKAFGRDLPILIYGFSGGAHFTSRFMEWKPDRVVVWCAYSAMWWNDPLGKKSLPPGIVACGDLDPRLGASLMYFKRGRAGGNRWLWIDVPATGHSPDGEVLNFVRTYFSIIWKEGHPDGLWVDVDTEKDSTAAEALAQPSLTAWLPDRKLLTDWRELNEP